MAKYFFSTLWIKTCLFWVQLFFYYQLNAPYPHSYLVKMILSYMKGSAPNKHFCYFSPIVPTHFLYSCWKSPPCQWDTKCTWPKMLFLWTIGDTLSSPTTLQDSTLEKLISWGSEKLHLKSLKCKLWVYFIGKACLLLIRHWLYFQSDSIYYIQNFIFVF